MLVKLCYSQKDLRDQHKSDKWRAGYDPALNKIYLTRQYYPPARFNMTTSHHITNSFFAHFYVTIV